MYCLVYIYTQHIFKASLFSFKSYYGDWIINASRVTNYTTGSVSDYHGWPNNHGFQIFGKSCEFV